MVLELMVGTYLHRLGDRPPMILESAGAVTADGLRRAGVWGLFCCDDVSAIQVVGRLRDEGASVPDDFGVVSYGNTDLARYFTPALTSVDPHNEEMAEQLVAVLALAGVGGLGMGVQHVVQPDLGIRGT